jgi:hypothetical protein
MTGKEQEEKNSCEQRENGCSTSTRVQRFRSGLREKDCGRLDVWIGSGWIRGLQIIAEYQKRPLWACAQDAIKAYVTLTAQVNVAPIDRVR